ncbi:MAG: geranylgeranylglycerol-phosphate geranylgeranyltransferase [Ignavibacteriaceae bacterium]|nr:geranylgeranylglycerol-phosphate geranylgeranyltransferase [Ignavibacteriaceae bacterium]
MCSGKHGVSTQLLFASFAAAFIAASANIINDYFDIEIDKINRPERILVSGKMQLKTAFILYSFFILGGIVLSIFVNGLALLIILGSAILTFYYSYKLKKIPLLGNTVVAFMTGLAFLFGGVAVGNIGSAVFPFIFAFTINFMREVVKDMEDAEGDARVNILTFPVKFGFEKAKTILYMFALFLMIAMLIPFLLKIYNAKYLALITFAVVPMLIYSMQILHKKNDKTAFGKVSLLLKLQMIFGLLAIFLGA